MKYANIGKILLSSSIASAYAGSVYAEAVSPAIESVGGPQALIQSLEQLTQPNISSILPAEGETARFIVKFKSSTQIQSLTERSAALVSKSAQLTSSGIKVYRSLSNLYGMAAELSSADVASLIASGEVEYIERDPIRQILPAVDTQVVEPLAESVPYGITMVQALEVSDSAIADRTVCITDTGYTANHEDLRSYQGTNISGIDNDGSGNDTGNWYNDGHGHGTHVAGTISAIGDNGIGVVGVSGSDAVGLYIVKVFDDSGSWGYGSDMIAAVEQCVAAGADVISMSLGGTYSSNSERAAFDSALAAGVLPIAAAGNSGNTSFSYPASYDSVMSVAAINSSKSLASFSQRNSQVEIAAPGVSVLSTLPGNSYEAWSGTSMATPHVSGVAALVWSNFPDCTSTEIRSALTASAEDLGTSGRDNSYGYGLVQAKDAVDYLTAYGCAGGGDDGGDDGDGGGDTGGDSGSETGLSASTGDWLYFTVDIPAGTSVFEVTTSGSNGDADLYLRPGSEPTYYSYSCRSWSSSSNEYCSISNPTATTWYIGVRAYSSFSNLTMSWLYE